jgi:hypothetical protein
MNHPGLNMTRGAHDDGKRGGIDGLSLGIVPFAHRSS